MLNLRLKIVVFPIVMMILHLTVPLPSFRVQSNNMSISTLWRQRKDFCSGHQFECIKFCCWVFHPTFKTCAMSIHFFIYFVLYGWTKLLAFKDEIKYIVHGKTRGFRLKFHVVHFSLLYPVLDHSVSSRGRAGWFHVHILIHLKCSQQRFQGHLHLPESISMPCTLCNDVIWIRPTIDEL